MTNRGNMSVTHDSGKAANTAAISPAEGPTAFQGLAFLRSFEPAGMLVMRSLLLVIGMGASGHRNEQVAMAKPKSYDGAQLAGSAVQRPCCVAKGSRTTAGAAMRGLT